MTRPISRHLSRITWILLPLLLLGADSAAAQSLNLDLGDGPSGGTTGRIIQLLALLTVLSLAPSIVITVTSVRARRHRAVAAALGPLKVLMPAFMISELRRAFEIGFLLFLPFVIIDMVVASVLMSMGMMMLPPVVISLPFKLIFFVLVDGWNLVAQLRHRLSVQGAGAVSAGGAASGDVSGALRL
jgi:flagellar biosynthesis protein FliP